MISEVLSFTVISAFKYSLSISKLDSGSFRFIQQKIN